MSSILLADLEKLAVEVIFPLSSVLYIFVYYNWYYLVKSDILCACPSTQNNYVLDFPGCLYLFCFTM